MILIKKLLVAFIVLLSISSSHAQIKNSKTETVKIYGNCGSCKKNIETAGNLKKVAFVNWDKTSKLAVLTFDSTKTNKDEILKFIALAGYDSDSFLAPNDAYAKLDACCQYDRAAKTAVKTDDSKMVMDHAMPMKDEVKTTTAKADDSKMVMDHAMPMNDEVKTTAAKADDSKMVMDHAMPMKDTVSPVVATGVVNQLKPVFDNYFLLKDALVKSSGSATATASKNVLASLNAVKMESLAPDVHVVWMRVMKDLSFDAEHISETQDVSHQRDHFSSLSKNMYELMKVSKLESETFYQFCPMYNKGKGANWLSKDNEIKNPYYGSQMLSCGRTVETIK